MPPSAPASPLSWKWVLFAILLMAGIFLALLLGPGTTPLVTPEGLVRP